LAELPEEDLQLVRDTLEKMLAGEFTRFDIFKGPITDSQGNVVLAEGEVMTQEDLENIDKMYWWNENYTAELPELE
jgi:basic membrane protein A